MPRKIYKPEEIIAKLRQVEVLTSQGQAVIDVVRSIGVTDATYYWWRQEYGGLKVDQVKRLKELEAENPSAVFQRRTRRWNLGLLRPASACGIRPDAGEAGFERSCFGKLLSPSRRRDCVKRVVGTLGVFERFACRVLATSFGTAQGAGDGG